MNNPTLKRDSLRVAAGLLALLTVVGGLRAEEYLSNLTNLFVDPVNPGAVNNEMPLEFLFSYSYPYAVHFFTGGGASETNGPDAGSLTVGATNAASFQLNWVTLEFNGGRQQPWTGIQVLLCQQVGGSSNLLGELGIAAVDPRITQWPEAANPRFCATYVDFLPTTGICLQPQSEYWVAVGPASPWPFKQGFGILFAISSNCTAAAGWRMGATVSEFPEVGDVSLKFALDATPNSGHCSAGTTLSNVWLSATGAGTNLSLRWPASPYRLYSTESLEPAAWAPWSATPFRTSADLVVSVPPSNGSRYFRLMAP
jgi:hypothetical protein